ncbi:ADP-ribosylglycohydrolase family protein [Thaumasiovibrio sp. DFM-14]|uniref:ADP-ribosylglycohydrolase family protein n=1 Tax=Thaumasiovibrio sp. DFM-14 TaxID=3384792 RepID=UPI0039A29088
MPNRTAALLGALVADAAALGTHWIYSPQRIAELSSVDHFPFIEPDHRNYEGVEGYFAHASKTAGEQSIYGEWLGLYVRLLAKKEVSVGVIQQEILDYFGPGGDFVGYVDTPTKALLLTLFSRTPDEWPEDSGSDDDQNLALCAVPPLVCVAADSQTLNDALERYIGITHNNTLALASAKAFASALNEAIQSQRIEPTLNVLQVKSPAPIQDRIIELRALADRDNHLDHVLSVVNQACHLVDSLPMSAWILQNTENYREAIIQNIMASGDSCGRAMLVGAIAGACYGVGGEKGIPISWLTTLQYAESLSDDIERLLGAVT